MSLRSVFEWVDTFESSIWLREAAYSYPVLLTAHVVTMSLFAGLIIMMDLRLVGWGNVRTPISQLQKRLFSWQMLGFGSNAVSGLILVYSQPMRYYGKIFFWIKMGLVLLAGVNAIVFHLTTYRSVEQWDNDRVLPSAARMAGFFGLFLWIAVIVFGRLTPYNWIDYLMAPAQ
jgi:hypothetical protein